MIGRTQLELSSNKKQKRALIPYDVELLILVGIYVGTHDGMLLIKWFIPVDSLSLENMTQLWQPRCFHLKLNHMTFVFVKHFLYVMKISMSISSINEIEHSPNVAECSLYQALSILKISQKFVHRVFRNRQTTRQTNGQRWKHNLRRSSEVIIVFGTTGDNTVSHYECYLLYTIMVF